MPTFRSAPSTQASSRRAAAPDVRGGIGIAFLGELRAAPRAGARPPGRSRMGTSAARRLATAIRCDRAGLLLVGLLRQPARARRRRRRPRSPPGRGAGTPPAPAAPPRAIGRMASCEAAYFSLESVSAATISASDAPMAPAIAAAVPPPGVGASEASGARNPSSESFEKSVMGGSSRPRGRGKRRRRRG